MNARAIFENRHVRKITPVLVGITISLVMIGCGGGGAQPHMANVPPPNTNSAPATSPTTAAPAVTVTAPINNSNVDPTVQFVASATSGVGVASMAISVDNRSMYTTAGSSVNTLLNLGSGQHSVIVTATDTKGHTGSTPVHVTVWGAPTQTPSNQAPAPPPPSHPTFSNLQKAHWTQYSLLPPSYAICGNCSPNGPQLVVNFQQGVANPSLSGAAMQTYIAGSEPYSDGFWNTRLVGDFSPNPDSGHTLAPSIHHLIYDVYFYMQDPGASQAIEFDINQFVNGKSFIWGHECRLAGGHQWDTWNNPAQTWVPSGIGCNPQANAWNHLVIEVERTSDDHLHFISITLNGNKSVVNRYDTPTATNWYGVTINYQQDGDYAQHAYKVWLDNVNLEYW